MIETAFIFSLYQSCRNQLNNDMSSVVMSGIVAGCSVSFILTPIELVKCRLQTQQLLSNESVKGPRQLIRNVLLKEGILGMYKGHLANCLREGLGGGVWFGVYEGIKRQSNEPLSPLEIAGAGALSGMAYNGSMFPIDVIKSRQQTLGGSFIQVAKQVWQWTGWKGFYRGLGITLFRSAPSSGSMFLVYVMHDSHSNRNSCPTA
jgi:ornithine carrier protein